MYYIFISFLLYSIVSLVSLTAIELDTSFGDNGKAILSFGQNSGHVNRVIPFRFKLLSDGKILLAGDIYSNDPEQGNDRAFVARYSADGRLDSSFGESGIAIFNNIGKYYTASFDIATQSNGNILIVGRASNWDSSFEYADDFGCILCLNKDGAINKSFGNNGIIKLLGQKASNGYICSGFYQIAVNDDDSIFAVGNRGIVLKRDENKNYPSADYKAIITKYTKDGVIDYSFGNYGIACTTFISGPKQEANGWAIIAQKDSKIIIVGNSENSAGQYLNDINGTQRAAMARFHPSGVLDETFGDKGNVFLPLDTKGAMFFSVILDDQERIIATGFAHNNITNKAEFLIARYLQDGELDVSFGQDGMLLIPVGTDNAYAYGTIIQPDGKILITGIAQWGDYKQFTLVRCTSNGQLDTSFGAENNGIYSTSLRKHNDRSFALALLDNKRLLIAGDSSNSEYFDSAIAQFRLD